MIPDKVKITRAEKTAWSLNHSLEPKNMVNLIAEVDATELNQLREAKKIKNELAPTSYLFSSLWVRHLGCACWVNAPSKAGADIVSTTWPWPITLSFGVVRKRAIVVDDVVQARLTMPILMSFDRRIMGGGPAGRSFAHFKQILESDLREE